MIVQDRLYMADCTRHGDALQAARLFSVVRLRSFTCISAGAFESLRGVLLVWFAYLVGCLECAGTNASVHQGLDCRGRMGCVLKEKLEPD